MRHFIFSISYQVLDSEVFPCKHGGEVDDGLDVDGFGQVDDACVLYCERFMEFLIDLLSQLPTRRYICIKFLLFI